MRLYPRSYSRFVLSAIFIVGVAASAAASDVRFASGHSALKIPFRLYNNHIYLQVSVNGSSPLWFVLDTGGGGRNLISTRQAHILGLDLTLAGQARGNGEATQDVFMTNEVSYALPGIAVTHENFAALDMEALEECSNEIDVDPQGDMVRREHSRTGDERQRFDGVIGAPFFKQFVVELDYNAKMMNLYEPKGYKYQGKGEAIPIEQRWPYIFIHTSLMSQKRATVSGVFMIDTGHMGAVLLSRPFVEKNALLPPDDSTKPFDMCGIGGYTKARIGPLPSIRLGSVDFSAPQTLFSQAMAGQTADDDYDGLIGNGILRWYKVIFDYSRGQMHLEPSVKK